MKQLQNAPNAAPGLPARRVRHDGWTRERQIAFIEKLADCGSISASCKHVGMSRESVRKLRRRPFGRAFRDACDAALDCGYADVEELAMERSRNGVARPIFYKGEQVGEWRHHDERLTMFLLRFRRRHRFGPEADSLPLMDIPGGLDPDEKISLRSGNRSSISVSMRSNTRRNRPSMMTNPHPKRFPASDEGPRSLARAGVRACGRGRAFAHVSLPTLATLLEMTATIRPAPSRGSPHSSLSRTRERVFAAFPLSRVRERVFAVFPLSRLRERVGVRAFLG